MSSKKRILLTILLFGSIWGGLEAVVSASMSGVGETIPRSAVLSLVALAVLVYARTVLPVAGTTLAIGLIAACFKFLGLPNLFMCQLAGVVGQAIVLEAAFLVAERLGWSRRPVMLASVVFVSAYANATAFCFSQAYVFGNSWWLERGVSGLWHWVATDGTLAAFAAVIGFALARLIAEVSASRLSQFAQARQTAFQQIAISVSLCCWAVGTVLQRL
jgi:hypothetical protein